MNERSVRSKIAEAITQLQAGGMISDGFKPIERFDISAGAGQPPEYQVAITHRSIDGMDISEAVQISCEVIGPLILIFEQAFRIVYPASREEIELAKNANFQQDEGANKAILSGQVGTEFVSKMEEAKKKIEELTINQTASGEQDSSLVNSNLDISTTGTV